MELHGEERKEPMCEPCPSSFNIKNESDTQLYKLREVQASSDFTSHMTCSKHIGQCFTFFCSSCNAMVCDECIEAEHFDESHHVIMLDQITDNCRKDLQSKTDFIEKKREVLDRLMIELDQTINDLHRNRETAMTSVNNAIKALADELERRRMQVLQEIEEQFSTKLGTLKQQKSKLDQEINTLNQSFNIVRRISEEFAREEMTSLLTNGAELNDREAQPSNCDNGSCGAASNDCIRSYLLHKYLHEKLDNNMGQISFASDTEYSRKHCSSLHNNLLLPSNAKSTQNSFSTETFERSAENSILKWQIQPDFQKLFDSIASCQIGHLITGYEMAQTCTLSGECLQSDVTIAVGKVTDVTLTIKKQSGNLKFSDTVEVDASLMYCDVITNNCDEKKTRRDSTKPIVKPQLHSDHSFGTLTSSSVMSGDFSTNTVECKIFQTSEASFRISFTPPRGGKCILSVKVHGVDVASSPSYIRVEEKNTTSQKQVNPEPRRSSLPLRSSLARGKVPGRRSVGDLLWNKRDLQLRVGSKGRRGGEFSNPQDVAFDQHGGVYVTDSNNQCIQVFQLSFEKEIKAEFIRRLGQKGRGIGQIHRPTGISLLPSGDLAISDYENKVVNIFSPDGAYKRRIGSGKLTGPRGVCVNKNCELVVVDNKSCQIFIFQMSGKLVRKFGGRGTGEHQLAGPHYVAVNQRNEVYVTDFYNHCVKVFSEAGAYLRSFGRKGDGRGQFNAPTGICMSGEGHVTVAEWGNNRLQVFDEDGAFLSEVNTSEELLYGPQGVAVAQQGFLAVADSGNQCVKIYKTLQ